VVWFVKKKRERELGGLEAEKGYIFLFSSFLYTEREAPSEIFLIIKQPYRKILI
jgi:hypothetical protein